MILSPTYDSCSLGSVLLGVLYKDLHEMFTTSSTEEDTTNNTRFVISNVCVKCVAGIQN